MSSPPQAPVRTPGAPGTGKKTPGAPGTGKKTSGAPGSGKKAPGAPGSGKNPSSLPSSSGKTTPSSTPNSTPPHTQSPVKMAPGKGVTPTKHPQPGKAPSKGLMAPPTTRPAPSNDSQATRARLTRFYQKYAPEKMSNMDVILKEYAGHEEELFQKLTTRYGPEPPPSSAPSASVTPSLASTTPITSSSTPGSVDGAARARLTRFYQKYAPEKMSNMDVILQEYAGHEEELFQKLTTRYGPEPNMTPQLSTTMAPSGNMAQLQSVAGQTGTAAGSTQPQEIDPYLKIPYSPVAPQMLPTFQSYRQKAIFYLMAAKQMVAGKRQSVAIILSHDALFVTKQSGEVIRVIPYTHIKAVLTNVEYAKSCNSSLGSTPVGDEEDKRVIPFSMFLLSADQQLADLCVVHDSVPMLMEVLKRVVKSSKTMTPLKFEAVKARSFENTGVPFRQPQDMKETQVPSGLVIKTKEQIRQNYMEQNGNNSLPTTATGDAATRARLTRFYQKYAPEKMSNMDVILQEYAGQEEQLFQKLTTRYGPEPEVSQQNDPVFPTPTSSNEPLVSTGSVEPLTKLPYVKVNMQAEPYFAGMKNAALLWFGPAYYYRLKAGGAPMKVEFTEVYHFLTAQRWYVSESEGKCYRCIPLSSLLSVHIPKDIQVLKASVSAATGALRCTCGILAKFLPPEPDLFIGFNNNEDQLRFLKTVGSIFKAHYPSQVPKFASVTTIEECTPQLAIPHDYTAAYVEVPPRPIVAGSEPMEMRSSHPLPAEVEPTTSQAVGNYASGNAVEAPFSFLKDTSQYIHTPKEFLDLHPPLVNGAIRWVGHVGHVGNPAKISGAKGEAEIVLSVGFLTDTHFYIALNQKYLRCFPIRFIKKMLRKSFKRQQAATTASGVQPTRTFALFALMPEQHDVLLEMKDEVSAADLFKALLKAMKQDDPTHTPQVGTFTDPNSEGCIYFPASDYQLAVAPIPRYPKPSNYRDRLTRFYQKYQPDRVSRVDEFLEAYTGNEEALFEKLVAKYGPEPAEDDVAALPPNTTDYHARLQRFCKKYIPHRLKDMEVALVKNKGNEEAMMKQLVEKYGPEPADEQTAAKDYRVRLVRYCYKYRPEQLNNIDSMLAKYRGREDEMMEKLVEKYGPEPPVLSHRQRLVQYCKRYFPDRLETADTVLQQNIGAEEEMFQKLTARYGPEPPYPMEEHRTRLIRFCEIYMPDRIPYVDSVLAENAGQEEELFLKLEKKYGPEPPMEKTSSMLYEDRLIRFYQKYHPSKVKEVDVLIKPFRGKEEEMFDHLVKKYGPEPPSVEGTHRNIAQDVYEVIDMTTQMPFAEIPVNCLSLFPSFNNAAIFWFSAVGHWEPPKPVVKRFSFMSSTHLYVAATDRVFFRCIPFQMVQNVYINSKRAEKDSKCALLFKVYPAEHDLFLVFNEDYSAKRMLWVFLELLTKYHFGLNVKGIAVESLAQPGIDAQCQPADNYTTNFVEIPLRRGAVRRNRLLDAAGDEAVEDVEAATSSKAFPTGTDINRLTSFGGTSSSMSRGPPPLSITQRNDVFGTVPIASNTNARIHRNNVNLDFPEESSMGSHPLLLSGKKGKNPLTEDRGSFGSKTQFSDTIDPANAYHSSWRASEFVEHEVEPVTMATREAMDESYGVSSGQFDELQVFLKMLDLEEYHLLFKKRGLTLELLQGFRDEDLLHFGVTYQADRERIMHHVRDGNFLGRVKGSAKLGDSSQAAGYVKQHSLPLRSTSAISGNSALKYRDVSFVPNFYQEETPSQQQQPEMLSVGQQGYKDGGGIIPFTPSRHGLGSSSAALMSSAKKKETSPSSPENFFARSPSPQVSMIQPTNPWEKIAVGSAKKLSDTSYVPDSTPRNPMERLVPRTELVQPGMKTPVANPASYWTQQQEGSDDLRSKSEVEWSMQELAESAQREQELKANATSPPSFLQSGGGQKKYPYDSASYQPPPVHWRRDRTSRSPNHNPYETLGDNSIAAQMDLIREVHQHKKMEQRQHPRQFSSPDAASNPLLKESAATIGPSGEMLNHSESQTQSTGKIRRRLPIHTSELTIEEVSYVLDRLGLGEHKGDFRRTDGVLLASLTKEDLRYRFKGDAEGSDILWAWMQYRAQRSAQVREEDELASLL